MKLNVVISDLIYHEKMKYRNYKCYSIFWENSKNY